MVLSQKLFGPLDSIREIWQSLLNQAVIYDAETYSIYVFGSRKICLIPATRKQVEWSH